MNIPPWYGSGRGAGMTRSVPTVGCSVPCKSGPLFEPHFHLLETFPYFGTDIPVFEHVSLAVTEIVALIMHASLGVPLADWEAHDQVEDGP